MNIQKAIQVIDTVTDGIMDETINLLFLEKVLYGKVGQELDNVVPERKVAPNFFGVKIKCGGMNDYMGSIRVFLDNYVSIVLGEKKKGS